MFTSLFTKEIETEGELPSSILVWNFYVCIYFSNDPNYRDCRFGENNTCTFHVTFVTMDA